MTHALSVSTYNHTMQALTGNIESYIQSVNGFPVLSKEEEQALAMKLQQDNDLEAARNLILPHLRFVVYVAKGYNGYGLPLADLIQEGNIGLMKAIKRFDPERGIRLVSFAVHWIRAEIHEYILRNWRIVKVATTKAQRKLFFNLRSAKSRLGWLNHEEVNNVARDLGVKPETVLEMESRLSGQDIGFDGFQDDDGEQEYLAPAAYLTHGDDDPAASIEHDDLSAQQTEALRAALTTLDARSQDILASRWLSEEKQTLHKLAAKHNISAERVRQLEKSALKKLKQAMS